MSILPDMSKAHASRDLYSICPIPSPLSGAKLIISLSCSHYTSAVLTNSFHVILSLACFHLSHFSLLTTIQSSEPYLSAHNIYQPGDVFEGTCRCIYMGHYPLFPVNLLLYLHFRCHQYSYRFHLVVMTILVQYLLESWLSLSPIFGFFLCVLCYILRAYLW